METVLVKYEDFKKELKIEKEKIERIVSDKIYLDCSEIYAFDVEEEEFVEENEKLVKKLEHIDDEIKEHSTLLKKELEKLDELIALEPKGLFKEKKIKQKDEDIASQKQVINNMLLIGWFD